MSKEMSESTVAALAVAAVFGFLGFCMFGAASCDRYSCERIGIETGLETKWDFWSTCYVKVNGKWVPKDAWREVEK